MGFLVKSQQEVCKVLDQMEIDYLLFDHKAVFTVEESKRYTGHIKGTRCKNLLLRNKKGYQHYLLVAKADKEVDFKVISSLLNESRLSLASPERLKKYMSLTPGAVSPFGLINDRVNHIIVLLDWELMEAKDLNFHPNVNTHTLTISVSGFQRYLDEIGNKYLKISF